MPYALAVNSIQVSVLTNANVTTSGADTVESTSLDVATVEGSILLTVSARASGTGTMAIAVTHSYDDTTFVAVPAAALIDEDTGEPATFSNVTTSASTQTLGLRKDLLRQYVRVEYTGTNLDQEVAAVAVSQYKYTERD